MDSKRRITPKPNTPRGRWIGRAFALGAALAVATTVGIGSVQASAATATITSSVADDASKTLETNSDNVGEVLTSKNVTASDDNSFNVTLSALSSTSNTISTSTTPLDIVLVLDTSGSMRFTMSGIDPEDYDKDVYSYTAAYPAEGQTSGEYYVYISSGRDRGYKQVTYNSSNGTWGYTSGRNWTAVVPKYSASDTTSGSVQFYKSDQRMDALQDALYKFIDETAEKNSGLETSEQHRVSIVTFASSSNVKANLQACSGDNVSSLKSIVSGLSPSGATAADYGMSSASSVLNNARNNAKKIVIFFTDGEPNHYSGFDWSVANSTIQTAGTLKSNDTTIYTIGIFDGANPSGTSNANKYMNAVSSNYPNASSYDELGKRTSDDAAYYKAASTADELAKIFEEIQQEITTGGALPTKVTSGSESTTGHVTFTDELGDYMRVGNTITVNYGGSTYTATKDDNGDYVLSGDVTDSLGNTVSLSNIKITVTKGETHDTVKVEVPGSLLPLDVYEIKGGSNTRTTEATPITINYSVSLDTELVTTESLALNSDLASYVSSHKTEDGNVYFYSNALGTSDDGSTTATFEPADGNPAYADGKVNKTVPKAKDANKTSTAKNASSSSAANGTVTTKLGNNGRVTVQLPAELDVSKTVSSPKGANINNTNFSFTLTLKDKDDNNLSGTYTAQLYEGTEKQDDQTNVTNGSTFTLKDGETLHIYGLPAGATYTVTEGTMSSGYLQDTDKTTGAAGTLAANTTSTASFTNKYTANGSLEGAANLKVSKTLSGRDWAENETYTFQISAADGTPLPKDTTITLSKPADGKTAAGAFGDISYTQADAGKEYTYTIKETGTSGDKNLTYSQAEYQVVVSVTDKGNGTMEATVESFTQVKDADGKDMSATAATDNTAAFTNTYKPTDTNPKKDVAKATDAATSINGQLVGVGDELVYTINWENDAIGADGKAAAATVTIKDNVPTGTEFMSAENGGTCADGVVTWALMDQAANAKGTVSFTVRVTDAAVSNTDNAITNQATINIGDNSKQSTTTTNYVPEKTVANSEGSTVSEIKVGQELTYTISYKNTESSAATVTITDSVPSGTAYVEGSASNDANVSNDGKTITWKLENVAANATGTVSFKVKVTEDALETSKVTNQASVKIGDNGADVKTNTTSTDVKTGSAKVSKSVSIPDGLEPSTNSFTISIALKDASGANLTDSYSYKVYNLDGSEDNGDNAVVAAINAIGDVITGGKKIANGDTVELEGGQFIVIEGLPEGATVTASENAPAGFAVTYDPQSVMVSADKTNEAKVVNTYSVTPGTVIGSDSLKVSKTLNRAWAEGETFVFTLKAKDNAPMPADAEDGVSTIQVGKDGGNFGNIEYTAPGIYIYEVAEVAGNETGMSYSHTVYTVTVEVRQKEGTADLEANATYAIGETDADSMIFANAEQTKTVTDSDGKDAATSMVGKTLTYTVNYTNNEVTNSTVTITDQVPAGTQVTKVNNSGVMYDADGKETTDVTEAKSIKWTINDVGAGESGNVSFQVKVTEDAIGETISNQASVKIGNNGPEIKTEPVKTTIAEPGSLSISKTVKANNGVEAPVQTFVFTVELKDAAGEALTGTYKYKIGDGEEQDVKSGGTINLTAGQTATISGLPEGATYTVTEKSAGDGWSTEKTGDTGTIAAEGTAKAEFTNTYTPGSAVLTGSTDLRVSKTLTGRDAAKDESFEFTLTAVTEGAPMPTGEGANKVTISNLKNGEVGSTSFGDISYTEAGTYEYKISETSTSNDKNLSISGAEYEVVVTVTAIGSSLSVSSTMTQVKNDKGETAEGSVASATFTNTYTKPEQTKSVESNGEDVDGKMVGVGDELTYTIKWNNDAINETGAAAKADVTVTDALPDGVTFESATVNGKEPAEGVLTQNGQTLTFNLGEQGANASGTINIKVKVNEKAAGVTSGNVATVKVGGNEYTTNRVTTTTPVKKDVTTPAIEKIQVGQTINYEVTFTADATGSATVVDNISKGLEYTKGDAKVGSESIASENISGGSSEESGTTITWTLDVTKGETYTISFSVTVTEDGISKVNNSATVNGHSSNVVTTPMDGTGKLTISKNVDAKYRTTAPDQSFTFTVKLTDRNDKALTGSYAYTGVGVEDGAISNNGIIELKDGQSITITGLPAGAKYTVTETELGGRWSISEATKNGTISSTVDSTAAFVNTYTPESVTMKGEGNLDVTKTLSGRDSKDGETFVFTLTGKNNAPMPSSNTVTISDLEDGVAKTASFGDIAYSAAGTYEYTITETSTTEDANLAMSQAEYKVVVEVAADGASLKVDSITITQVKDDSGAETGASATSAAFTNTYTPDTPPTPPTPPTPSDPTGDLVITKTVVSKVGEIDASKEFAFTITLKGSDGKAISGTYSGITFTDGQATVTLKHGESVTITGLPAGATYTVTEAASDGYTSSSTGASGTITASGSSTTAFTNTYDAKSTSIQFHAAKVLNGRDLVAGEFSFQLIENGQVLQTVTNAADGSITFAAIEYSEPGEHDYTIVEVTGSDSTITYDATVYSYHVSVVDDGSGKLVATWTAGQDAQTVFTNTYTPPAEPPVNPPTDNNEDKMPKVGDTTNTALPIAALVAGCSAVSAAVVVRKKRKSE